jgi:GT2 family glycosyltransferase
VKVVAAVLTHRADVLRGWLGQRDRPPTFIVVNGSSDSRFSQLGATRPAQFPNGRDEWFFTGHNYFYTGGWNRGIAEIERRYPGVEFVWICDDGSSGCTMRVMNALVRRMEENPDVAMASPANPGNPHWYMRPQPGSTFRRVRHIDYPAALLRMEAWHDVGAFDENFSSYGNDYDWAIRAKRAGWTFGVDDTVEVRHSIVGDHGGVDWRSYFVEKWGTSDYWALLNELEAP